MFNIAIQDGRLASRPYILRMGEAPPRRGFFEYERYAAVLSHLPEHLKPIAEFAYYTGWRQQEICSLTWEQVEWDKAVVRLWVGETKNGEGRVLPLEFELRRIMEEQKEAQAGLPLGFSLQWRAHQNVL